MLRRKIQSNNCEINNKLLKDNTMIFLEKLKCKHSNVITCKISSIPYYVQWPLIETFNEFQTFIFNNEKNSKFHLIKLTLKIPNFILFVGDKKKPGHDWTDVQLQILNLKQETGSRGNYSLKKLIPLKRNNKIANSSIVLFTPIKK